MEPEKGDLRGADERGAGSSGSTWVVVEKKGRRVGGTPFKETQTNESFGDTSSRGVTLNYNNATGHIRSRQEMGLQGHPDSARLNVALIEAATSLPKGSRNYFYEYLAMGKSVEQALFLCKQYSEQQRNVGSKRNNTHITPPENHNKRIKDKTGRPQGASTSDTRRGPTDTYASVTRVTKVAILPLEFPKITMSQENLGVIENLLAEKMCDVSAEEEEDSIEFDGIHFRDSMIIVDALNETTIKWIKKFVDNPAGWEGVKLAMRTGDDIPPIHTFRAYFPKSKDMSEDQILRLIKCNNIKLNTNLWRFVRKEMKVNGQTATVSVDLESYNLLLAQEGRIRYRFKTLVVRGLKRRKEEIMEVDDELEEDVEEVEKDHTPTIAKPVQIEGSETEEELLKEDEEEDEGGLNQTIIQMK